MDLTKQKAQTNEGMLKEEERIFDEFAKILEKQAVSSPTENFIVDWKSKFKEFVSLVKRMREAQEELDVFEHKHDFFDYKAIMKRKELTSKVIKLESEVDEYLKKMEI